jgi:hypothetical protein
MSAKICDLTKKTRPFLSESLPSTVVHFFAFLHHKRQAQKIKLRTLVLIINDFVRNFCALFAQVQKANSYFYHPEGGEIFIAKKCLFIF